MWLVNVATLRLEEFLDETEVAYAILSHRWQKDEILFQDIENLSACRKAGKAKLLACCEVAKMYGLRYVWVDTCCIDKKSSSELQEAINSMFRWYSNATACFAYLYDVQSKRENSSFEAEFRESVWFTRCWTLQELIAPPAQSMTFFNASWQNIGRKFELINEVSKITGIDCSALDQTEPLHFFSIAERMCWASKRQAQRVEDQAYSLLGLFNINMPMLYGEGSKAFERLCELIVTETDDETIFAWSDLSVDSSGLLARSPAAYLTCAGLKPVRLHEREESFALTNRGLRCQFQMERRPNYVELAFVNAAFLDVNQQQRFVGIFLQEEWKFLNKQWAAKGAYTRLRTHHNGLLCDRWEGSYDDILGLTNRNPNGTTTTTIFVRHKGFTFSMDTAPRLTLLLPRIDEASLISRFEFAADLKVDKNPFPKPPIDLHPLWDIRSDGTALPFVILSTARDDPGALCNIHLKQDHHGFRLIQIGISCSGYPMCTIIGQEYEDKILSKGDMYGPSTEEIISFDARHDKLVSSNHLHRGDHIVSKSTVREGLLVLEPRSLERVQVFITPHEYANRQNPQIAAGIRITTIFQSSRTYVFFRFQHFGKTLSELQDRGMNILPSVPVEYSTKSQAFRRFKSAN